MVFDEAVDGAYCGFSNGLISCHMYCYAMR